jgi:hypothetical protein
MFIRFYSKMLFPKGRNVIFPAIFLTGLSFIYATGQAQLSPVPPGGFMAGQAGRITSPQASGLLFYLSGNKGFTADFADGGQVLPNYLKDVWIIPGGAHGTGFSAEDSQLMPLAPILAKAAFRLILRER